MAGAVDSYYALSNINHSHRSASFSTDTRITQGNDVDHNELIWVHILLLEQSEILLMLESWFPEFTTTTPKDAAALESQKDDAAAQPPSLITHLASKTTGSWFLKFYSIQSLSKRRRAFLDVTKNVNGDKKVVQTFVDKLWTKLDQCSKKHRWHVEVPHFRQPRQVTWVQVA